jgi:hypothetical protein
LLRRLHVRDLLWHRHLLLHIHLLGHLLLRLLLRNVLLLAGLLPCARRRRLHLRLALMLGRRLGLLSVQGLLLL